MIVRVIILGCGILIGSLITLYLTPKPNIKNSLTKEMTILKSDFDEYVHLKKLEDKYLKADEILGKVMLIFIANLGLEMTPDSASYFGQPQKNKMSTRMEKEKERLENSHIKTSKGPAQPFYSNKDITFDGLPHELLRDFRQLRRKILATPEKYLASSTSLKSELQLSQINGEFSGFIYFMNESQITETHKMDLVINLTRIKDKYEGNYKTTLSLGGQSYSINEQVGENTSIRSHQRTPNEIILKTSPNSFVQMFVIDSNHFFGNFYDDGKFIGMVKLLRI